MNREEIIYKVLILLCLFSLCAVWLWAMNVRAEEVNVEALASAIGRAENSKAHPYGIMQKYEHTSPRQACVNTIKHALKDFDGKGDFISFLQQRYAPINCENDNGTNRFWASNVRYFYNQITGR